MHIGAGQKLGVLAPGTYSRSKRFEFSSNLLPFFPQGFLFILNKATKKHRYQKKEQLCYIFKCLLFLSLSKSSFSLTMALALSPPTLGTDQRYDILSIG